MDESIEKYTCPHCNKKLNSHEFLEAILTADYNERLYKFIISNDYRCDNCYKAKVSRRE